MKINNVQNVQSVRFTGLIKHNKKIPTISLINPTSEDLRKLEEESKKQIEELGLIVIKKVQLAIRKG